MPAFFSNRPSAATLKYKLCYTMADAGRYISPLALDKTYLKKFQDAFVHPFGGIRELVDDARAVDSTWNASR